MSGRLFPRPVSAMPLDGMARFTLRYQRPQHQHDEHEDAGWYSEEELLKLFRSHPWESEVNAAAQLQRVSPTFWILTEDGAAEFMASAVDGDPPSFYLFYITQEQYRRFGLFPAKRKAVVDALGVNLATSCAAISAFCRGDEVELKRLATWRGW